MLEFDNILHYLISMDCNKNGKELGSLIVSEVRLEVAACMVSSMRYIIGDTLSKDIIEEYLNLIIYNTGTKTSKVYKGIHGIKELMGKPVGTIARTLEVNLNSPEFIILSCLVIKSYFHALLEKYQKELENLNRPDRIFQDKDYLPRRNSELNESITYYRVFTLLLTQEVQKYAVENFSEESEIIINALDSLYKFVTSKNIYEYEEKKGLEIYKIEGPAAFLSFLDKRKENLEKKMKRFGGGEQ